MTFFADMPATPGRLCSGRNSATGWIVARITIEVDDAELAELSRAFDGGDPQQLAVKFAGLAMAEHLNWITGRARHRSLTEEHLARIKRIYEVMLSEAEAPSFNRLYNSFNLPHGQAMYLARALSDMTLRHWRRQAIVGLLADLKRVEAQARQRQEAQEGDKGINIHTSKMGALELSRMCDAEFKVDRAFIGVTPKGGIGDQRSVELAADSIVTIIAKLKLEVENA